MVSARACAYQFLPHNSSGFNLLRKIPVQADGCLHYEQIYTLVISVGGQEGKWGKGTVRDFLSCRNIEYFPLWRLAVHVA